MLAKKNTNTTQELLRKIRGYQHYCPPNFIKKTQQKWNDLIYLCDQFNLKQSRDIDSIINFEMELK